MTLSASRYLLICWFSLTLSLNCDPHSSQIIDRSWCLVNCKCWRYKYFLPKVSLHCGQVNDLAFLLRSRSCIVKWTWNCWFRLKTSPQVLQMNGYFLQCFNFLCSMMSWKRWIMLRFDSNLFHMLMEVQFWVKLSISSPSHRLILIIKKL